MSVYTDTEEKSRGNLKKIEIFLRKGRKTMLYYLLRCYKVRFIVDAMNDDDDDVDEDVVRKEPEMEIEEEYLVPLSCVMRFRKCRDGYLVRLTWARHEVLVKGEIEDSLEALQNMPGDDARVGSAAYRWGRLPPLPRG